MKKNAPALCVEGRPGAGSPGLPAPAVAVVVVVLLIIAGLLAFGLPLEAAVTAVVAGGLVAKELVLSLVCALSPRRA
ncbi:hypothetical protein F7R91_39195 [Streptomyces luteolifulvus]|uniref:Uncharacterized protein n=1 Tax=Streptomyces luteolifulvus TaxID=2615112 RepID=A0A6H9UNI2_9ACTN|nr:hypothetical protein [Streptomyces luteolifulvus]KAB1139656.1 hypothetical protein F7R91_39195 [Streptomyces luteolifulvus]